MQGIDVSQAARVIAWYMPESKIDGADDHSKTIVDHLERQWSVSPLGDDGNERYAIIPLESENEAPADRKAPQ